MSPSLRFAILAVIAIQHCAALASDKAPAPYPNTSHFGVPTADSEDWYKQCMRVVTLRAPAVSSVPAPPADCHAQQLYYTKRSQAVTSPAEWASVRACAIARGDNAVLMMVYANGFGVARDADMALHYACSIDDAAKGEMESRVAHLTTGKAAAAPFDQCDDITSGYMGAICSGIREGIDQRVRTARLDRLARALAPVPRAAFARLRAAAERYATEAMGEVDMQGTGAAGFAVDHRERVREQFMQAALDTASGKLPAATAADDASLDDELNVRYKAVMAAPSADKDQPDRIGDSTITRSAVRSAERAWLAYRDAFVAFVATLPSGADALAVKSQLTRERIGQLSAFAKY